MDRETIRAYVKAEINHSPDCTPEVAAARERYDQAGENQRRLYAGYSKAREDYLAAGTEYHDLWFRAQPLRALLVDALDRVSYRGGPGTAKQIAGYVRRTDVAGVQACLDVLVADGWIRREARRRGGYGYAPCWTGDAP